MNVSLPACAMCSKLQYRCHMHAETEAEVLLANQIGRAEGGVVEMLKLLGELPEEVMSNTPGRVVRAFLEMTRGYRQDPAELLKTTFVEDPDEFPRLVNALSQRLQMQEKLGRQIAEAIREHVKPHGVGVVLASRHDCMTCRGVRASRGEMVTSVMLDRFREDQRARTELLMLLNQRSK